MRLVALGQFEYEPGRHQHAIARIEHERAVLGHGSQQIEACGVFRLVGGKRQPLAMGEGQDPERDAHPAAERTLDKDSAARAKLREAMGLSDPLWMQYFNWLGDILREGGDWQLAMLAPEQRLEVPLGMRLHKLFKTSNGGIEVSLQASAKGGKH